MQNIIGTEHITDAAEAAIAAQASGGATLAFKTVAVSGQSDIVADASTDTLTLAGAGGTSITTNAGTDTVTITSSDTQLSTEQVQDIVGAMFTGNTETNITATYEDSDGTIDLVASGGSSAPDSGLGGVGYIRDCDVFDSSGNSSTAIYCSSLGLGEASSSSFGPALNPATLTFFPIIMPKTGTLSKLGIRFVGGAGGSDTAFGIYRADSTKLRPTGSVVFSQNFTPTTYTSYDFTASVSVTAGEILWVAWFGYSTTLPTLASISSNFGVGQPNLPAEKAGALTGLYTAKAKHIFRVSGNTFGTFPTIGSSYFDNAYATEQQTTVPRIGMVIS